MPSATAGTGVPGHDPVPLSSGGHNGPLPTCVLHLTHCPLPLSAVSRPCTGDGAGEALRPADRTIVWQPPVSLSGRRHRHEAPVPSGGRSSRTARRHRPSRYLPVWRWCLALQTGQLRSSEDGLRSWPSAQRLSGTVTAAVYYHTRLARSLSD